MGTSNLDHETSIFHRLWGMVLFDSSSGALLCADGPREEWISAHWGACVPFLLRQDEAESVAASASSSASSSAAMFVGCLKDGSHSLSIYRGQRLPNSRNATGLILDSPESSDTSITTNGPFDPFFIGLILNQSTFALHHPTAPLSAKETQDTTASAAAVTALFDSYLRYQGKNDKWATGGGSEYFLERTKRFTAKRARIEFCLPAFPCKSSNINKVTGKSPDRGEWLALERLHSFVEAIEKVYPPGALVWIISDGHVFSDCIGVDDADVDRYGEQLAEMNRAISLSRRGRERVQFRSLVDLFRLHESATTSPAASSYPAMANDLGVAPIDHHVPTSMTQEAELCRRILMAGCQDQRSGVRGLIDSADAAVLALYRGFARFMLEDLELHPFMRGLSRSKQKKVACEVAFEMILRNRAYSNLVEMLFPHHLRLSIHAHDNAGPKFGIQLFDPSSVRAAGSLSPDAPEDRSVDLLHIPTPWHNSVVQLGGEDKKRFVVTKSKIARDAVGSGVFEGGLVVPSITTAGAESGPRGACFELWVPGPVAAATAAATAAADEVTAKTKANSTVVIETREVVDFVAANNESTGTAGGNPSWWWLPVWLGRLLTTTTLWRWSAGAVVAAPSSPYAAGMSKSACSQQHRSEGFAP